MPRMVGPRLFAGAYPWRSRHVHRGNQVARADLIDDVGAIFVGREALASIVVAARSQPYSRTRGI